MRVGGFFSSPVNLFTGISEVGNDIHGIIASHAVIVPPAYAYRLPVQIIQYLRDFERTAELVKKQYLFAVVIVYPAELVIRRSELVIRRCRMYLLFALLLYENGKKICGRACKIYPVFV